MHLEPTPEQSPGHQLRYQRGEDVILGAAFKREIFKRAKERKLNEATTLEKDLSLANRQGTGPEYVYPVSLDGAKVVRDALANFARDTTDDILELGSRNPDYRNDDIPMRLDMGERARQMSNDLHRTIETTETDAQVRAFANQLDMLEEAHVDVRDVINPPPATDAGNPVPTPEQA